ncbi:virion morphogenesis (tail completion) protein [Desulfovibrio sp. X2]|uniref:phage virion morphogenesis protein n=1 Tax=Desulfovibrio sp. X2 TaxID=941449 RepID=UPI000358B7F9|nr:phage virion morphogenesis protein [Desulfovibrio sp. X2]EPR43133.1 virion morphogenesis (tail completion) protein [Desulfovibrio sp. X2]
MADAPMLTDWWDSSRSARLDEQLAALGGEIRDRMKYARRLAGYVRTQARRNIRRQETVDGGPFSPRKQARADRAMLAGLAKGMEVVSRSEAGGALVTWKSGFTAKIAFRHQRGVGEDWTPEKAEKVYGRPNYDKPCTRRQAQALVREGYRLMVPMKGGGRRPKRVTVTWLEKHFTLGHAGIVLRLMRTQKAQGKQSWRDTVPARTFLGVTSAEADKMCERLAKTVLGSVPR